jgi:hypothetical protein
MSKTKKTVKKPVVVPPVAEDRNLAAQEKRAKKFDNLMYALDGSVLARSFSKNDFKYLNLDLHAMAKFLENSGVDHLGHGQLLCHDTRAAASKFIEIRDTYLKLHEKLFSILMKLAPTGSDFK